MSTTTPSDVRFARALLAIANKTNRCTLADFTTEELLAELQSRRDGDAIERKVESLIEMLGERASEQS
jgi:hypothetical protein